MGVDHPFKPFVKDREHLAKYLPKSQEEMPKRSMQDSYIAASIPLSQNIALQEKYVTFLGSVRLGRLMEDMDIFAGKLYESIQISARPKLCVPIVFQFLFSQLLTG